MWICGNEIGQVEYCTAMHIELCFSAKRSPNQNETELFGILPYDMFNKPKYLFTNSCFLHFARYEFSS